MTLIDWIIVIAWVAGTSMVGLFYGRKVKSLDGYLLAGRKLSWWQVSAAQAADQVDSSDFVGASGLGYRTGMTGLGVILSGQTIGFVALSRWVLPSLYKSGVYTNAEYMEDRYTRELRVFSMVLQVLYRIVAIAIVVYTTALMFQVVLGVEELWTAILAAMAATVLYTFLGGQVSAVMASIPQMALILFCGITLSVLVCGQIGGLANLSEHFAATPELLRLGGYSEPGVPTWIYYLGMILTFSTYPLINQAVAQRALAARSQNHARLGTVCYPPVYWIFGSAVALVGLAGLAMEPGLSSSEADRIYPSLMVRFLPEGLLGLGVAGMLVAAMSTAAGIGTAVSGLLTIDLYRRFLRPDEADSHYLLVARLASLAAIAAGTLLSFFIERMGGIVDFYVALTGTLFMPLMTPYLALGLYPKASRRSGMTAVVLGAGLGLTLMVLDSQYAHSLGIGIPVWLGHSKWRPIWVFIITWIGLIGQTWYDHRRRGIDVPTLAGGEDRVEASWYQRPGFYEGLLLVVLGAVFWYGW